jgi:mannose-6-phosphate isomerase-like protein (cupin superfamily)
MAMATVSQPGDVADWAHYPAPFCVARGTARGELFHPDASSLWRVLGELSPGAELEWGTGHGDEVLFVLAGALECDGKRIGEGSSVIVEAGVPAAVRSTGSTRVVHFGPMATTASGAASAGAAGTASRRVHVMTREEAPTICFGEQIGIYFGDGTCPTCSVTLFLIDGSALSAPYVGNSHAHSADEIIHVLSGEVRVGPLVVTAGRSIVVPGGQRYRQRIDGPFQFLNYRAELSTFVERPGSEPMLETLAHLRDRAAARCSQG